MNNRLFLRISEAAASCGVSRRTLWSWISQGLPAFRVGGVTLIRPDKLREWLEKHAVDHARTDRLVDEVLAGLARK